MLKIPWYLLKETYMVTHRPAFFVKENLKKCYLKRDGKTHQHGNVFAFIDSSEYSYRFVSVDIKIGGKKAEHGLHVEHSAERKIDF